MEKVQLPFWLSAMTKKPQPLHHSLKGAEISLILVESFCLESHTKTFLTECILAYGCYKYDY